MKTANIDGLARVRERNLRNKVMLDMQGAPRMTVEDRSQFEDDMHERMNPMMESVEVDQGKHLNGKGFSEHNIKSAMIFENSNGHYAPTRNI